MVATQVPVKIYSNQFLSEYYRDDMDSWTYTSYLEIYDPV